MQYRTAWLGTEVTPGDYLLRVESRCAERSATRILSGGRGTEVPAGSRVEGGRSGTMLLSGRVRMQKCAHMIKRDSEYRRVDIAEGQRGPGAIDAAPCAWRNDADAMDERNRQRIPAVTEDQRVAMQ